MTLLHPGHPPGTEPAPVRTRALAWFVLSSRVLSWRAPAWRAVACSSLAVLWSTVAAPAAPAAAPAPATPGPRPNIVILYADDMGWGDLAAQNPQSKIPTPHLDRLAREGTRFTDAHSSSGVCTPSRYALLHGRYHWRKFHGIVNSFEPSVLDPARTTLAELLQGRGYRTACIGKWHLGWNWAAIRRPNTAAAPGQKGLPPEAFDWSRPIPDGPLAHGFHSYFGDDVPNFPPYAWIENDRVMTPPTVPLRTPPGPAEGNWEARPGPSVENWDFHAVLPRLAERAENWINDQTNGEPFFLYFAFTSPHAPMVPSGRFNGLTGVGGYGDFLAQTDDVAGRILAALDRRGLRDRTIVVFSSDNGPESYAYERFRRHGHRSMGPFRGLKRDLYEGGHRIPLIVRWPGVVPANRVSDGLISQIDLYATLAAALGVPVPAGSAEDSLNQLPLWKGQGPSARRELVHNTQANGYALRDGDWLYIAAPSGAISAVPAWFNATNGYAANDQPAELYNLQADPAQKQNLLRQNPEKAAALAARLRELQQLRDRK